MALSTAETMMKMLKKPQTALLTVLLFLTGMEARANWAIGTGFGDVLAEMDVTFEALPGKPAARNWTFKHEGSVRLVGRVGMQSTGTNTEFRVLVDSKPVWSHTFDTHDSIPHAFDIVAYDLTNQSNVELVASVGPDSRSAKLTCALQVVPEPFVSRWHKKLPTGYPTWTEKEKRALRNKGQDILKAIRDASATKAGKLVVPPGDYLFHANWSRASTLKDLADLEIIAKEVTFWFEPPMVHGLLFENCRNVTVRGLTFDFTVPIFTQARITEIDRQRKSISAELMDDYQPRGESGQLEPKGERKLIFYDASGAFLNHRHTRSDWTLSDDGKRILYAEVRVNPIPESLQAGHYVVSPIQTGAALRSVNCANMHYEDINIFSSPGMAVYEGGGEGGHVYTRVRATRRPSTNRLHAFGADVFHLAGTDQGPVLDRCESAYGADDNLNIHGSFGRVVKKIDDRHYYLEGVYGVGDTIEFRDWKSLDLLGIANVVSVKTTPDGPSITINKKYKAKGQHLVELDKSLTMPPLSLVVHDSRCSADGFVVRNCWFHDNFQRTLINGSPNGLIENNTLQNVGMGVRIQFETWGPWMEGPFARNLVIRNNRFLDSPPGGTIINVSMHPPGGGSNARRFNATPVTNMVISGNYLGRTTGIPVSVHNVDGLKIHGNSIDHPRDAPNPVGLANSSTVNWLYLQDCQNVSVRNNLTAGTKTKTTRHRKPIRTSRQSPAGAAPKE